MKYSPEEMYDELEPLVGGSGYSLVDCTYVLLKGTHHVGLSLFSPNGIGTDECAQVFQLVQPRLEVLLDTRDVNLEVGSPGLDRKIHHPREYKIFAGQRMKILVTGEEWISAIVISADDTAVEVKIDNKSRTILLSSILKAQLEFTWEDT